MNRHMNVPMTKEEAASLKAGDYVYLTGTIYTARDAAHKRMDEALDRGESLPFDIEGSIIYYMGPSPARELSLIHILPAFSPARSKKSRIYEYFHHV